MKMQNGFYHLSEKGMTNIKPAADEESEFCHFVTTDTMTYPMFHMTSSDRCMNDTEIISFIRDKYHLYCKDADGSEEAEGRSGLKKEELIPAGTRKIDYGSDLYEVRQSPATDGRTILTAWMQTDDFQNAENEQISWSRHMILPREVSIHDGKLIQRPIRELENYFTNIISYKNVPVSDDVLLYGIEGRTVDLEIKVRPLPHEAIYKSFEVRFAMDQDQHIVIRFDTDKGLIRIGRKQDTEGKADTQCRSCSVRESMDGYLTLRIILDRYSYEIFINDGQYVLSSLFFYDLSAKMISFRTVGKAVADIVKRDIRI